MANTNDVDDTRWVEERLRSLATGTQFQPDATRARSRLGEREQRAAGRVRGVWIAVATAALAIVMLPWPRALAQQVWNRLLLGRVEVVQFTREDLPETITAALTLEPQPFEKEPVANLVDAERRLGFRPALPPPGVLAGTPNLSIVRSATFTTRPLSTADIERALAAAGASDITVPREWNGTTLMAEAGPVLVAEYDDVEVMQSPPFRLTIPAGVQFGHFMEVTFRVLGRDASEAKRLAAKMEANPALIMHFPERAPVRDVLLRSGQGSLVGDPDGSDGMCFFWHTSERIYIVSAGQMSEAEAILLANSIQE